VFEHERLRGRQVPLAPLVALLLVAMNECGRVLFSVFFTASKCGLGAEVLENEQARERDERLVDATSESAKES
jgi:hypothetical protein